MGMTKDEAEGVAARERARGEYGEITIRRYGDRDHVVEGSKVVNGQGIGRTWRQVAEDDWRPSDRFLVRADEGGRDRKRRRSA